MCKHFTDDGIKADNDDKGAQTRLANAAKALDIDMNEYVSYEDLEEKIADLSQQDKTKTTGGEIIRRLAKHWLKENGYDGFVCEEISCSCSFKQGQVLFRNKVMNGDYCPWDCVPGYLDEKGNIVREKPEDPKEKLLKELEKDLKELGFDKRRIKVAIGVLLEGYIPQGWPSEEKITEEDQKAVEEESSHPCVYWKPNKTKGRNCTFECGDQDSEGYSRCYASKATEPNCPFFKAID